MSKRPSRVLLLLPSWHIGLEKEPSDRSAFPKSSDPSGLVNICLLATVCDWQDTANTYCFCCGARQTDTSISLTSTKYLVSNNCYSSPQLVVFAKNRHQGRIPVRRRTPGTEQRSIFLLSQHRPNSPWQESDIGTETGTGPITPKVKPSQSRSHTVGYHSTRARRNGRAD